MNIDTECTLVTQEDKDFMLKGYKDACFWVATGHKEYQEKKDELFPILKYFKLEKEALSIEENINNRFLKQ